MPLPMTNTTVAIYRPGEAPPDPPAAADVAGLLRPTFRRGLHDGRLDDPNGRFSHVLLVQPTVDIRDGYDRGDVDAAAADVVIEADDVSYRVVFVERRNRGSPEDHLRVYLARKAVV